MLPKKIPRDQLGLLWPCPETNLLNSQSRQNVDGLVEQHQVSWIPSLGPEPLVSRVSTPLSCCLLIHLISTIEALYLPCPRIFGQISLPSRYLITTTQIRQRKIPQTSIQSELNVSIHSPDWNSYDQSFIEPGADNHNRGRDTPETSLLTTA